MIDQKREKTRNARKQNDVGECACICHNKRSISEEEEKKYKKRKMCERVCCVAVYADNN